MTSDKRIIRASSNAYRWHLHQHAGAAAANKVLKTPPQTCRAEIYLAFQTES